MGYQIFPCLFQCSWESIYWPLFQVICLHLSGSAFIIFFQIWQALLLSIRGLLNLIVVCFSETNTKQTKQIIISSLDINMCFNRGLPFFWSLDHFFLWVRSMSWKLVRQFLLWTSSIIILNFLNATSSIMWIRTSFLVIRTIRRGDKA